MDLFLLCGFISFPGHVSVLASQSGLPATPTLEKADVGKSC